MAGEATSNDTSKLPDLSSALLQRKKAVIYQRVVGPLVLLMGQKAPWSKAGGAGAHKLDQRS